MAFKIENVIALSEWIKNEAKNKPRIVIAVSGFGGSGKSTVSNKLSQLLGDAYIVHVDDFIEADDNGAKKGYLHDWQKLEEMLFKDARKATTIVSKTYDWSLNKQVIEEMHPGKYLIIEGSAGLFQEKYIRYFDIKIWLDVTHEVANIRGKKRDSEEYEINHDDLWDNVWSPRESKFFEKQRPDLRADILFKND